MKKILATLLVLGIAGCTWYLFIKKYDYQIRLEAAYGPGSVYQEIIDLKRLNKSDSLKTIRLVKHKPFHTILQRAALKTTDSVELLWHFQSKNDSITQIKLDARSLKNRLSHRLAILNPFVEDKNISLLKKDLLALQAHLRAFQQTYKVDKNGIKTSPGGICACVSSTTTAKGKANAMKATIGQLEDFLVKNDLKQSAPPIVQLTSWDITTDKISFDFCFPLNKNPEKEPKNDVFIKKIEPKQALSATFHGNYLLSQRVWYDLYEQAREEKLNLSGFPLEVFESNPKNGGNPITWKADIYLPISD